mgnify:CR=1 FL=1
MPMYITATDMDTLIDGSAKKTTFSAEATGAAVAKKRIAPRRKKAEYNGGYNEESKGYNEYD